MQKVELPNATLYCGNSLEIMDDLDPKSFDICLTDPPYILSGVKSQNHDSDNWTQLINVSTFFEVMYKKIIRLLKDDAIFWSFMNWRSLPAVYKASSANRMNFQSLLVWDKEMLLMSSMKALRTSYEMCGLWTFGDAGIKDRSVRDVFRRKWRSGHGKHGAEKPVDLCEFLIEKSGPGNVFDPFMGSGAIGEAAVRQGRHYVGIETDAKWFSKAVDRIAAT